MPKRDDIKSVLVIGAGPIVIGQACEFDYSGTQAIKALKEEGLYVILINSNPATIMTDPSFADKVYIEPISLPYLEKIIAQEKPDAILATVGGQTALNAALELASAGILEKYKVELIGAKVEAIEKAEDRKLFKKAMQKIGAKVPHSGVANSLPEARDLLHEIGLPIILRPSFTLGGAGGGVCYNNEDFDKQVQVALSESPVHEVLIEQSVLGWKEFELEVMRDLADNVVIICSIENIDAMGVHTGDSITVAPQQTLSDKEYQKLRDLAIKIIREIGVETGGSNVQFAINPKDGEIIVIEMNPRVSRSSALASKATGFPIARIAAKLSIGYTLDEIPNDITQKTPASFEPSIDYIVTKIPRFTFEKFPESPRTLDTQMRSVGEAMSIGRTFPESFQKALRSLENDRYGWGCDDNIAIPIKIARARANGAEKELIIKNLMHANDERIYYVREAMLNQMSIDEIYRLSHIDPWFLHQFQRFLDFENSFSSLYNVNSVENSASSNKDLITDINKGLKIGYHHRQLALLLIKDDAIKIIEKLAKLDQGSSTYFEQLTVFKTSLQNSYELIKTFSKENCLKRVFKTVDTCAAEFESFTPYMYSCYESEDENYPTKKDKVIILGGGPNRIGQGIEFDYCCCHASFALQELDIESIMINSNPETVSTDYDTSDRLYFEPLDLENILSICEKENVHKTLKGVILQFGGQTPLKLSRPLEKAGIKILGTSPNDINRAEDRKEFHNIINSLGLKQPKGTMAASLEESLIAAEKLEYPVLARPSYVLGGRAMAIVHNKGQLKEYMKKSTEVSSETPILIDKFLENATEIDVDALCDLESVYIAGIMEHIEEAGVHSGDSACILPPKAIAKEMLTEIQEATKKLAYSLNVIGLINIQFAIYNKELYVIEVNPRASRTVPFVSKATGIPLAKLATRIIMGEKISSFHLKDEMAWPKRYYVKEVVLPFKKFSGADSILGPEMKSTGEVMGIGNSPAEAFVKAQEASWQKLPRSGNIFISINDASKQEILTSAKAAHNAGFKLLATKGTSAYLNNNGISCEHVLKRHEGRPNILDQIKSGVIQMIINIPTDVQTRNDAFEIRLAALRYNIPYMTTLAAAIEALLGMSKEQDEINVYPLEPNLI